jgi:beta-lactamase regulating signal transducer with metallopeptidase domain
MSLDLILQTRIIQAVGWALFHLLWQGTLVAILLAAVLAILRRQAAAVRYVVSCAALVLVAALPVLTAWNIYRSETKLGGVVHSQPVLETHNGSFPLPELRTTESPVTNGSEPASPVFSYELAISRLQPFVPLFVILWGLGVTITSARVIFAWTKLQRLALHGAPASPEWQHALARLTRRIRLTRPVRLMESAAVEVPTVIGWLRPVVLLPLTALTGLSRQQLETILAHELAHVRRHDFIVNLFQTAVETLFFYHPAVWWISSKIRVEREHCCDDLAVELCGNPVLYARALADLEQTRFPGHAPALALTGGNLLSRVRRLIAGSPRRCSAQWLAGVSVITVLASLAIAAPLTLLAMVDSEDPEASMKMSSLNSVSTPQPAEETITVRVSNSAADDEVISEETNSEECDETDHSDDDVHSPVAAYHFDNGELDHISAIAAVAPEIRARAYAVSAHMPELSAKLAEKIGFLAYAFTTPQAAPVPPVPPAAPRQAVVPRAPVAPRAVIVAGGEDFDFSSDFDFDFDFDYDVDFDSDFEFDVDGDDETEEGAKAEPLNRATLTVDDLIRLKNLGVTAEYIEAMERSGFKLSLRELTILRHAGFNLNDLKAYAAAGLKDLSPREAARLKMMGVTPEFIREMRATFPDATNQDLIRLRNAGVSPTIVIDANSLAGKKLTIKEVVKLSHLGVDRKYVQDLARAGYTGLTVDELVRLKALGVTPEFVQEMKAAGFTNLTPKDVAALRAAGVDAKFVKSLRDAGLTELSAREIIKLRHAGVDAEFIRQIKKGK